MLKIKLQIIIYYALILNNQAFSQVFTDSNLPIVIINTNGATIPDEPKIGADLKIIYRGEGQRNYLTDVSNPAYLNYNGRIGIEVRGTTSATAPQKPYGFETRMVDDITKNNVSILGMPSENDWILLATYIDKSLIRDYLAYNLARKLGNYSARGKYCEVILNGQYDGIYILQEKIKRDKNRVDISEMSSVNNTLPTITGGYLLQEDDNGTITLPHEVGTANNAITIEEPEEPTIEQSNYIQNFMLEVDASTLLPSPANLIDGYPSKLDLFSFYNYFIINELFTNPDGYSRSTYYAKDLNDKLQLGPVWDFNSAAGNNQNGYQFWEVETGYFQGPKFLKRLFNSENFRCHLIKKWQTLRQIDAPLNTIKINFTIDSVSNSLFEAQERHFERWPILGDCNVPSSHPNCLLTTTHQLEVDYLKNSLQNKITWIDNNIGLNFPNCTYTTPPKLVINEIMYDPLFVPTSLVTSLRKEENISKLPNNLAATAVAEDYEFIEIKNNETSSVDLTGMYFRGGGIVYQFPANSSIPANGIIVLASNAVSFEERNGFAPFGQFTKDLSNKGETLILADAMGNEIDKVVYTTLAPWPYAYGKSIELITSTLDNTLPANWFQQTVYGGSPGAENVYVAPDPCLVLPNVVINEINYRSTSSTNSDWIEIYNAGNTFVNLSGWQIKDSGSNPLILAENTTLAPNSYLVFVEKLPPSIIAFTTTYPAVTNYYPTAFTFGLSSAGEQITLKDANGCIVDQVTYGIANPWPTSPNGQGNTLSLKQPNLDKSLGENWAGSTQLLGTPGAINFPSTALPVTLVRFDVVKITEQEIQLNWLTVNEINLEKFEIQKSVDAKNFDTIGYLKSLSEGKYEFLDTTFNQKTCYYRLKIIDLDGNFRYSKVKVINISNETQLLLYPNPAQDFINVELAETDFSINIFDLMGRNIFNNADINSKIVLPIKNWVTGLYFLKLQSVDGKYNFMRKISIIK